MSIESLRKEWGAKATEALKGKVVKKVTYSQGAPTVIFEDGTFLVAMQDDECNGPGALYTNLPDELQIIPTIH